MAKRLERRRAAGLHKALCLGVMYFASVVGISSVAGPTAQGATYLLPPPGVDVIGEVTSVRARQEDTLSDIARRYSLGFQELILANPGVDPWVPGEGREIHIPSLYVFPNAPRDGIVINVPEMRLYYFPKQKAGETPIVVTYPMSVGRMEWKTPLGTTKVVKKQVNPTWFPTPAIRAEYLERGEPLPASVPPGPDNPLGGFAMRLGIPGYLIHGTDKPYGVGMRVTHGCVRLYPEDIRALFDDVPVGTPVHIVNQPIKAGWRNGLLHVEVHPPLEEDADQFNATRTPIVQAIVDASPVANSDIDWEAAVKLTESASGVPVIVSTNLLDVAAVLRRTQESAQQTLDTIASDDSRSQTVVPTHQR